MSIDGQHRRRLLTPLAVNIEDVNVTLDYSKHSCGWTSLMGMFHANQILSPVNLRKMWLYLNAKNKSLAFIAALVLTIV
jgi:hypothetical protein